MEGVHSRGLRTLPGVQTGHNGADKGSDRDEDKTDAGTTHQPVCLVGKFRVDLTVYNRIFHD